MTRVIPFVALALGGCGGTFHPAPMQPWEQTDETLAAARSRTAADSSESEREPDRNARTVPSIAHEASPPARRILRGRASYYHDSLAGNPTASGEPYDPRKRTAASRTLPFGTRLRVTRIDTGATTIVRVNDRGPFGDRRRILDLSRRAAEDLDMIRAGVIRIRAEIIQ
jgi:rare lipoprotein A